eukprot:jgi/Tetstr1/434497/TSEL_023589.t1
MAGGGGRELGCKDAGRDDKTTPRRAAALVLLCGADRDRVLLLRHMCCNGKWGTPGGYVDRGESFFQGLKREFREETGVDLPPVENIGVDLFGEPGRLNYVTLARRWRRHKEVLTRVYVLTPRNGGGSLDGLLPPDHVITRSKNNETDRWETPLLAEVLAREPPYDTLLRGGQWSSLSLARVSGLFSHIPGICTDWGPAPHRLASREQPLALCSSGPGWWHWQKYRCWVPYSAEVNAKLEAVMDEEKQVVDIGDGREVDFSFSQCIGQPRPHQYQTDSPRRHREVTRLPSGEPGLLQHMSFAVLQALDECSGHKPRLTAEETLQGSLDVQTCIATMLKTSDNLRGALPPGQIKWSLRLDP